MMSTASGKLTSALKCYFACFIFSAKIMDVVK